jgi:hypothetical protein
MNVFVLNAQFPGSAWRRTFADALIRLRPDMNPDAADELSDSAYVRLGELEPGEAALRYAEGRGASAPPAQARQASPIRRAGLPV